MENETKTIAEETTTGIDSKFIIQAVVGATIGFFITRGLIALLDD